LSSSSPLSPHLPKANLDSAKEQKLDTQFPNKSFPKQSRLRKRGQFLKAQRIGKRLYTSHLIVYVSKNHGLNNRLGLTVSKKVGKANHRNQVKRCIREAFRHSHLRQGQGFDVSVIAKQEAPCFEFKLLLGEFDQLARQIQTLSFDRSANKRKNNKTQSQKKPKLASKHSVRP
jgi:ribonuclease P protein component